MTGLHKFRPKYRCLAFVITAFSIAITSKGEAHYLPRVEIYSTLTSDTIPQLKKMTADTLPAQASPDSLRPARDTSLGIDTLPRQRIDTFSLKLSKDTLDAPVSYEAEDSAVLLVKEKKFLLYGKTKTNYKDVELTAPKVMIDQKTNIVTAYSSHDSLGNVVTRARLKQGQDQNFESDTITYNFKTQRGLTLNTYTKQDEMWIQANQIKKVNENTTFARHVIMTTCDFDEPHFGFVSSKGKFTFNLGLLGTY